ncbi:MAG: BREX system serine/threonine kinase PglW, partial [Actinomycetota bacterium]
VQDEPLRTRYALALARVAVETERAAAEPRLVQRRDAERVFLALSDALAEYGGRLGDRADQLATEDPLAPPARALERLREVAAPSGAVLPDARLLRLAVSASRKAALSSRQELYPRGMDPARALKLSQGALYGVRCLTVSQIQERVRGRYPLAAPLPDRPALDTLLREAGIDFRWEAQTTAPGAPMAGCYVARGLGAPSLTSGSRSLSRYSTARGKDGPREITPEVADARVLDERLERGLLEGAFVALVAPPRHYDRAARELGERFPVEVIDFEAWFLEALRETAASLRVRWELVLQADVTPGQGSWGKLLQLTGRALAQVEQRLLQRGADSGRTLLLTHAGVLARYDAMDLLARLRDRMGRAPEGEPALPGLWLLLPGDEQALLDGRPVPLLGPGQRARVPETWLRNEHRAAVPV